LPGGRGSDRVIAEYRVGESMTNWTALVIALLVIAAGVIDQLANGGAGTFFLVQKFIVLLEWVVFWR
jgi:hypothetical protein